MNIYHSRDPAQSAAERWFGNPKDHVEGHARRLVKSLRRQWLLVIGCTAMAASAGFIFVLFRPITYTARGLVLVENTRPFEGIRQELLPVPTPTESSIVDTQVEIIRSEGIALRVIDSLKLANDQPLGSTMGLKTMIREWLGAFGLTKVRAPVSKERAFLQTFQQNLIVRRIRLTSMIEIGFKSDQPERSAQITNEVMNTYLADQSAASAAASTGASAWLRERVKEIGAKSRIINFAGPPIHNDGPRSSLLLTAFSALGFLGGVGLAVIRSIRDTRLREPAEVLSLLDAPHIASVRKARSLHALDLQGQIADDCRQAFRTVVALAPSDKRSRLTLCVGSILPGEGVSTIAVGIAQAAAESGRRVLVLDASVSPSSGASDKKRHTNDATDSSHHNNVIDYMEASLSDVALGSTSKNKSESPYGLVLVQLPPIITNPDVIAAEESIADKLILVTAWNAIPAETFVTSLARCTIPPAKLLGFVFNKVPTRAVTRNTFPIEAYLWKRKVP